MSAFSLRGTLPEIVDTRLVMRVIGSAATGAAV